LREATQGCIKLSILSPRGTSGERTEERGYQQKRTSSPQPSPPSDGGGGEIEELDAALDATRCGDFVLYFSGRSG